MKKEEMIEKLKIIYEKIKEYEKYTYFSQYVPTYYEFTSFYDNSCSFGEIYKLTSDISFLHNLIFSVSKDIKEIIEDSNEERSVYTITTAEGTELRIRFPELLAPVLEEYKLKNSDGVYSFEKVKDKI